MRGAVFADTGFWLARLNPLDRLHAKARETGRALGDAQVVTSDMVLTETLNALSGGGAFVRGQAVRLIATLQSDAQTEIVQQTPLLFGQAVAMYRERTDKSWSLTDCMSFLIMRKRHIKTALAHDRHFEQAGFTALLRE